MRLYKGERVTVGISSVRLNKGERVTVFLREHGLKVRKLQYFSRELELMVIVLLFFFHVLELKVRELQYFSRDLELNVIVYCTQYSYPVSLN